jgi:hypothetical protein
MNKFILTLISFFSFLSLLQADDKTVSGYFIGNSIKHPSLFAVDSELFVANAPFHKEILGDDYDKYAAWHKAMVTSGFDDHTPIRLRTENNKFYSIYIPTATFSKITRSHPQPFDIKSTDIIYITVSYEQIVVDKDTYKKSTKVSYKLTSMPSHSK